VPEVAHLVVEGLVDEAVARALVRHVGLSVGVVRGRQGKGWIDANISSLNHAARYEKYFVVRDFDGDDICPGRLIARLVVNRNDGLVFRCAVQSIESWILADSNAVARWLRVPEGRIPNNTDTINSPKEFLRRLGSQRGRDRRRPMFYDDGDYTSRTLEFIGRRWSPARAYQSDRSASLRSAVDRLRQLAAAD
jgi:hypothetical protein